MKKEIKDVYNKYDWRMFPMALGYAFDKGQSYLSEVTEDEIQELDGNPMMTKEFVQDLVRYGIELSKFSIFDLIEFKNELDGKEEKRKILYARTRNG